MKKSLFLLTIILSAIIGWGTFSIIGSGGQRVLAGGPAGEADDEDIWYDIGEIGAAEESSFDRPASIQVKVDEAFEKLQDEHKGDWGLKRGDRGFYLLGFLDEAKIIRSLVTESKDVDIYLLDIGAGHGAWGREAKQLIEEEFSDINKHFHIISVTGTNELKSKTITEGNVTLYEIGTFKIENIETELAKNGLDLKNKVNLIVTNWTLRHLVDPLGTLKQLYDLLTPDNGILLGDEFYICLNNEVKRSGVAVLSSVPVLITNYQGQYILLKKGNQVFSPPILYTGDVEEFFGDSEAKMITCFETTNKLPKVDFRISRGGSIFGGNDKARDLFDMIRDKDWFSYGDRSHRFTAF